MTLPVAAPSTQVELRSLLQEVQAAAMSPDAARLTTAVNHLRETLESDVGLERRRLGMALIADLEAGVGQDSTRPCLIRLAELAALRRHEVAVERRMSGSPAPGDADHVAAWGDPVRRGLRPSM